MGKQRAFNRACIPLFKGHDDIQMFLHKRVHQRRLLQRTLYMIARYEETPCSFERFRDLRIAAVTNTVNVQIIFQQIECGNADMRKPRDHFLQSLFHGREQAGGNLADCAGESGRLKETAQFVKIMETLFIQRHNPPMRSFPF